VGFFGIILYELLILILFFVVLKMSDRKENYSQFFNQLCDEINKYTSFKVYISIRYSNKILNDLWNKYIKNGIEIPNNLLNQ